ncbi:transporter [Pelomonas sp. V22]|uniref:MMPL family transporter n=1 Tax=Pelomonas sp. V22 TaxID=2822139 RepID=UPI0024A91302|nr:MMPL family transporter [Pelomonas sp. V22]MDI4635505.1 transporter [Pelomonas sp. V22]
MSLERVTRRLAGLWLVLVLACVAHNVWYWAVAKRAPVTDMLAMLPRDEQRPLAAEATQALADAGARRISVLIGGGTASDAGRAADAFLKALGDVPARHHVDDAAQNAWLGFYAPARSGLLSASAREQLAQASAAQLADQALAALYQPVGGPRVGAWADDPIGLFGQWLAERGRISRVRVLDGRLMLNDPAASEHSYALVLIELAGSGFEIAAQRALQPKLDAATEAAKQLGAQVITAGVPLFAAAASDQAEREIHTIGLGSLVGIVALTLLAFRSLRPRLLVALSMAVGLTVASSVSLLVFGELHLVTLVFGASLLGVAENYGSNYFSARQGLQASERWAMLARQIPIVSLAMATTVIGYALLALPPFPGLRQIAVFSAVGLMAAFVTVLWWFPLLDGRGRLQPTRFADWLGSRRALWPALGRRGFTILLLLCALLLAWGASRLRVDDDIRQLQSAPTALVAQQREFARLMQAPGLTQFFVVQGRTEQQLLEREEALTARLRGLQVEAQAVSDWLPSLRRQREDAALASRRAAELQPLLSERLGQPVVLAEASRAELEPKVWLASPVSEPVRAQWLGPLGRPDAHFTSVVLLKNAEAPETREALAALQLEGVSRVDKVGEVSQLLGRYRLMMSAVLALGFVLTWAALAWRFGRRAWRALAPTALACALTVALLAIGGQVLQLFHILPLLILLGLGVDYGIFLLEQPGRRETQPFLSVTLAAASTLLSFGLLALSGTPALRAFGLTLLIGVFLAWLLTPFFMPHD